MGSVCPGSEGEGLLVTGYGALDTAWSTLEGEGIFTESRGLEPYYLDLLDRKYGQAYGADDNPANFAHVPMGRQAMFGETLGNGAILGERNVVKTTYRPQPEALGMTPGRQPSSDLWRADDAAVPVQTKVIGFMKDNPIFTAALVGGVALLGFWFMKR